MDDRGHRSVRGLTRREVIKRSLQAGAYAAPVILSATIPAAGVAAATPPASITFGQDALLSGAGANATFDVYYTRSDQAAGTFTFLGSFTTDRFGFGGGVFPLTFPNPTASSTVTINYWLHGNAPPSPPANTTPLVDGVIGFIAAGTPRLVGTVVQEPTVAACQVGPLNQYNEFIDVALVNAKTSTAYDFYVQPNTVGAPVKVTTATTDALGNVTVFASTPAPITTATPTSVVVSAVLAGGSPSTPAFSFTANAANRNLTTISCTDLQHLGPPRPLGITP